MPVLVSVVCRRFHAIPVLGLFAICMFACSFAIVPAIATAQSSILETVPANTGQSIFDSPDDSPASKAPAFRAAANGVASIDDDGQSGQSTFTSSSQADGAPSVPSSLLVPQSPTEDDYSPAEQMDLRTNDLRGERIPRGQANSAESSADRSFTQSSNQSYGGQSGNSGRRTAGNGAPESPFGQSYRSSRNQNPAQFDAPMVQAAGQFDQPSSRISNQSNRNAASQSFGDKARQSNSVRSRVENPFGGSNEQATNQPMKSQPPPSVRFSEPTPAMSRLSTQTPRSNQPLNRQQQPTVATQGFSQVNNTIAPLNSVAQRKDRTTAQSLHREASTVLCSQLDSINQPNQ